MKLVCKKILLFQFVIKIIYYEQVGVENAEDRKTLYYLIERLRTVRYTSISDYIFV